MTSSIDWWQKYKHLGHTQIIPDLWDICAYKFVFCAQNCCSDTGARISGYASMNIMKNVLPNPNTSDSEVSGYSVAGYARFDCIGESKWFADIGFSPHWTIIGNLIALCPANEKRRYNATSSPIGIHKMNSPQWQTSYIGQRALGCLH